ncbi:MAG: SDR family oxidoreductase [Gammaproteobacteria bacterium]|nr:SDR family oxidoreductase [Gammaproteobacteria bacterium]
MRVLVSGASGALGQEVCRVLTNSGHDVLPLRGVDLSDPAAAQAAIVEQAAAGNFDGVVNIAGGFTWETVLDGEVETWDRLWAMNLKTALNTCRAAIPHMHDGGSIINIGAAASVRAAAGLGAYTASKSAVARLTEALAAELSPRSIRVNAVLPTIFDTPANRKDMPDADFSAWVTTEELANIIRFLLSPESAGINGASIPTR